MNMRMIRFYAHVSVEYQRQGIKILVLEYDVFEGGWYLLLQTSLEEGLYDEWYQNKKDAELSAKIQYNITHNMWKPLDCETYRPWVKRMNLYSVGFYAPIPFKRQRQGIQFLVLKADVFNIFGEKKYFLFAHESLEEPCLSVSWYSSKNSAETTAELRFGITPNMWKELNNGVTKP